MKIVGVVGKIGSGKSTFRRSLEFAFPGKVVQTIDLDNLSSRLKRLNTGLQSRLINEFGPLICAEPKIAASYVLSVIFPNDDKYRRLTQIYEPYIATCIKTEQRIAYRERVDVLFFEGAGLIHSANLLNMMDSVIVINNTNDTCIKQVRERCDRLNRSQYTGTELQHLLNRTTPFYSDVWCTWEATNPDRVFHLQSATCQTIVRTDEFITKLLATSKPIPTKTSTTKVAIYAGSFNPLHKGHIAVAEDLLKTFDQVILVRCTNGGKGSHDVFDIDASKLPNGCRWDIWCNAFVDYLELSRIQEMNVTIVRGIRNGTDLEYETNYIKHLQEQCKFRGKSLPPVLFVPCRDEFKHISSSSIRAILPFDKEYAASLMP